MPSNPSDFESPLPAAPGAASLPGDPFPWAPQAERERDAAPIDAVPEPPPEEPEEEFLPRDLGEVD